MFMRIIVPLLLAATPILSRGDSDVPSTTPKDGHAKVTFVRGFVRWQADDTAKWKPLISGEQVPICGKLAVGVGSLVTLQFTFTEITFDTTGIIDLQTGLAANHVSSDTDPPGVRTMAATRKLFATAINVQGHVQWRAQAGEPWVPLEKSCGISEAAEIRVGLRSLVVLLNSSGNTITIDRLGTWSMKRVLNIRYTRRDGLDATRYPLMQTGAVGETHDSIITAPAAKLEVR